MGNVTAKSCNSICALYICPLFNTEEQSIANRRQTLERLIFFYGRTGSKGLECTDISTQDISNITLELIWSPAFQGYFILLYLYSCHHWPTSFQSCINFFFPPLKEISPSKAYLLVPFPIGYHSNGGHTQ